MSVKRKKANQLPIELPSEDVPFDDVVRTLLAAPPSHESRPHKKKAQGKPKTSTRKKRGRS